VSVLAEVVSYDGGGGCAATHATGQGEPNARTEEAVEVIFVLLGFWYIKTTYDEGEDEGGGQNSCCEPITDINDSRVARQFEGPGHSM